MVGHGITKDSLTRLRHEKSSLFPKPLQFWEPDQTLVFFFLMFKQCQSLIFHLFAIPC